VAGGGTAGHVQPGLAVARTLVARGHPPASVHFVGSRRGLEATLVPEAGFTVTLLPGRGFARRLSPATVTAFGGLLGALAASLVVVGRRRPRIILCLGGYAAVPCALAAVVWRCPIVVMEQNAVPGAANRLVARFARACAVSFEGTALPRAVVTGNPVRDEILALDRRRDRAAARAALGLPADRHVVAVFGGSLGARRINGATTAALDQWRDRDDLAVRHAVGSRDWTEPAASPEAPPASVPGVLYQAVRYEERMDLLLAAADLAVCRAGATSVAELTVVGLPAVLVPLPGAPGDHQSANAAALAGAGAAVVVPDDQLDGPRLARTVDGLLSDPDRLEAMAAAARALSRRDAAQQVVALVERHADGPDAEPLNGR